MAYMDVENIAECKGGSVTFVDELNRKAEVGEKIKKDEWVLPGPLCENQYRFIKIRKNQKIPIEKAWQTTNNYNCVDPRLVEWISNKNNYGVACGFGNLLVIDFDDKEFEDKYIPLLPPTFTVVTGSGGHHLYYICDDPASFKITDGHKKTFADFQGTGKQVIGAGSTHPNGNKYYVKEKRTIATLKRADLENVFSEHLTAKKITVPKKELSLQQDEVVDQIKRKLNLMTVLSHYGFNTSHHPTACKIHNSNGGKEFDFNESDQVWYCHGRCSKGGDMFELVKEMERCDFPTAKNILKEMAGIKEAPVILHPKPSLDGLKIAVLNLLADKKRSEVTEVLTQHILNQEAIFTTRDDERSETWIYKEGIYVPQGKTYIKEICRDILGKAYTTHLVNLILVKIEISTFISQEELFVNEVLDLVPVKNGLLNIKTKELLPFDKDKRFFYKLPLNYTPEADCPAIKKFFDGILQADSDKHLLQEIFGFLIYREYTFEKAFMFLGSGRNGKGKTLELMKHFVGPANCANLSLKNIETSEFMVSGLHNKLANLSGDLSKQALENTGKFKQLTGRDLITANRKFLQPIHFTNFAKMIFCANELPETKDQSDGFFNRWEIIDFVYKFVPKRMYDQLQDKNNIKIDNPNIIKGLCTQNELDGLLNWALDGLDRLRTQGGFSSSLSAKQVKEKWLRKSSNIIAFVKEHVEQSYDGMMTKKDFRTAYWMFCQDNVLVPVDDKKIKQTLMELMPISQKRVYVEDEREYVWAGIKFKKGSVYSQKLESVTTLSQVSTVF